MKCASGRPADAGRGNAKWHPAVDAATQRDRKPKALLRTSALQRWQVGVPRSNTLLGPHSFGTLARNSAVTMVIGRRRWERARTRQRAPFFTRAVRLTTATGSSRDLQDGEWKATKKWSQLLAHSECLESKRGMRQGLVAAGCRQRGTWSMVSW